VEFKIRDIALINSSLETSHSSAIKFQRLDIQLISKSRGILVKSCVKRN